MEATKLQDIPSEKRSDYFDRKAIEAAQQKQEELLVDFDAAHEEYKKKEVPLVVKFMGETFEVPRSRPTSVTIFTARNQQNGQMPDEKYYTMLEMVFGKRFIDKMEECEAPLELVTEKVMQPLFEKWGVGGTGYKKK